MKKMLINANQQEEVRIALVNDKWLYDLYIENVNNNQKKSNIYKGKIIHIENSLEAIFVDYGSEKHGFLPLKEISDEYIKNNNLDSEKKINIKDFLKEGQEILVQVTKEERFNKGAVLTTFITLAGSYLILIPNNNKSRGISKRIDKKNRKNIKNILNKLKFPNEMGIIIRTSGIEKTLEDFQNDLDSRLKHWELIKLIYNKKKCPSLIYKENNLIVKIFRDYFTKDISEIIIDNEYFIEESKKCLIDLGRQDLNKKIIFFLKDIPLFSFYEIECQIESAFKKNVKLPSGGSISIDYTEALTAIDINSYRSTKCIDIEETAFHTNLEAANEISRQLRLRDLGGLIIIDFIDMNYNKNCREVEKYFKKCTYQDRAKIRFGNISKFGLLEISRQRLTNSLNESNHYICPRCKGDGFIRNNKSLSLSILRLIEEESLKEDIKEIHIIVPVSIGTYLLNEKRYFINNIEKKKSNKLKIIIIPYDKIKTPNYMLTKIKKGEEKLITSYSLPYFYDKNLKYNMKKKLNFNKSINFNKNIYKKNNEIKNINNFFSKLKLYLNFLKNITYNLFNKVIFIIKKNYFFKKNKIFIKNNYNKKKFSFKFYKKK